MDFDERLFYCSVGLPFILSAMNRIYEGYDPNGYTGQQPQEEKKPSMLGKVAKYGALGAGLLGAAGLGAAALNPEGFGNATNWMSDKLSGAGMSGAADTVSNLGGKIQDVGQQVHGGAVDTYKNLTTQQVDIGTNENPKMVSAHELGKTQDNINKAIDQTRSNLDTVAQQNANQPQVVGGNTGGNPEEERADQHARQQPLAQNRANDASLANSDRLEQQRMATTQSRVTDASMRNSEQLEANRQANAMAQQQAAAQDRSLNSSNQVELNRQANAQAQQNAFSQQQNSLNNTAQVENNRQANAMAQQNNFATNRSLDNSNQLEAQRQATTQAQMNNSAPSAPTRGDPMQANANAGPTRNDPMQQSPGPVRNDPMQANAQPGKSGSSLQTLGVRAASRWGNQAVNSAVGKMDHAVGAAKGAISGAGRTVV